mgnify:FL=1
MKEQIQKKLNDSKVLRWSVLALVAFTMLCGYFLTDVMSPLKPMLEKELLWDSLDYGILPVHTVGSMSLPLCLLSVVSFWIRWECALLVWEHAF